MNWNAVSDDQYYSGRKAESLARIRGYPHDWIEFAAFKAGKASYLMAAYGEAQAAVAADDPLIAEECRKRFFEQCEKGRLVEVSVVLAYMVAARFQSISPKEAVAWYEGVADLASTVAQERNTLFFAADALEHAAEISLDAGLSFDCARVGEMWERNAAYWEERDEADDADWSLERARLFGKLSGIEE